MTVNTYGEPLKENYYRLWHRCLQLSDRARWTQVVEDAFGHCHGMEWPEWWENCRELFEPLAPRLLLRPLSTRDDYEHWVSMFDGADNEDTIVIGVHLHDSKDALEQAFRELLQRVHPGKRGRPKHDDWGEWAMVREPDIDATWKALDVWAAKQAEPDKPLWKIALDLKITAASHQLAKDRKRFAAMPTKGLDVKQERFIRAVLTSTASRLKDRGEQLVRGVERGVFPAHSPDDSSYQSKLKNTV